ncbi:MAG TPA: hypothetical protein VG897_13490 [Terriglobales bacterium]|nr:hypothetical protein [Terriglobales bacterium]
MLNKLINILLIVICLTALAVSAFGAQQTLTGTVTDTMCGKKHMMPGKTDAECVRECMKHKGNWSYGLLVGDKVYSLVGDNEQFDSLAGQRVQVAGDVTGDKITVQTITAAK